MPGVAFIDESELPPWLQAELERLDAERAVRQDKLRKELDLLRDIESRDTSGTGWPD